MERDKIEQLLAEYINGEILPDGMQQLEKLFKQDPALKEEAHELLGAWQSLSKIETSSQPDADMDEQFYAMLQRAKADERHTATPIISLNKPWLKAVAAILICITAFGIGRFTAPITPVLKYKTVFVKQPEIQQQQIVKSERTIATTAAPALHKPFKKKNTDKDNSVLAQQLRSVYASERIAAVMKIAGKAKLNTADLGMLELALKEDPSLNVRLTIINTLQPLAGKANVQKALINALSHQDDALIQRSIVDLLIDAKSKQAVPQMIALLDDKGTDFILRNKIKDGIEHFLN